MRQITLSNGKTITLNSQQEEALSLLHEWRSTKDLFFLLAGYAGTGKTTIVTDFLENAMLYNIAVSAPTHKAKKEISKATGLEGKTIQSLLGLGVDVDIADFDPEDKKFKPVRTAMLKDFELVVIDETSMLNKEAVAYIKELARKFGTRIIFMGDKAQLPPISEVESLVFSDPEITFKYQLSKVERQSSDNPIMGIYDSLRDSLNSARDPFDRRTNFNEEEGTGIKFLSYGDFAKEVLHTFTGEHFDPMDAKILCWTNKEVAIWNNAIRKRIVMKNHPERTVHNFIEEQDLLVAVANRGNLVNSDEYLVKNITKVNREFLNAEGAVEELPCLQVLVYNDSLGEDITFHIIDHNDAHARSLWLFHYNDFVSIAVKNKRKWRDFFTFRDAFLLMENIDNPGKKPITRDLDYGYALTVHRSQGSTYDSVYVVETDLNKNRNHRERNQLKYVALSRPRKKAILLSH